MCCFLCIEIAKQNMTPKEIAMAYFEATVEDSHNKEILSAIEEHVEGGVAAVAFELQRLDNEDNWNQSVWTGCDPDDE